MPEVAPASTDMLQMVSRPEVGMFVIVSPWNSITLKLAPSAVNWPIRYRIRSLGRTFAGNSPLTTTLIVAGTSTFSTLPSAQTEAISVAPMPKAKAPSAPWLVVWLSVPTTTAPGADVAVLGQDLVADAALVAADVVELGDALLADELAHLLLVGGGLRAFGRDAVVEDDGDLGWVPDLGIQAGTLVDLLELVEHQRGVLVRHGQVDASARPRRPP